MDNGNQIDQIKLKNRSEEKGKKSAQGNNINIQSGRIDAPPEEGNESH